MTDEPILELPPLTDSGTGAAGPEDDALSPFELPPLPDPPAAEATKVRFELPPGFEDLDLPAPETTNRNPVEVPPFLAEMDSAVLKPDDAISREEVLARPPGEAPVAMEVHPDTVRLESPAEPAEPSLPVMADEENHLHDLEPPVAPVPARIADSIADPIPEDVATGPVAEDAATEPTDFHPDGSLERLVEALERTLPKPSPEDATTLRRANRAGKRYLRFALDNRAFLIDADRVREIGLVPPMTFLPRTPDWVRGLTNLRGEMLSVVDLRRYLGLGESVPDPFLNRLVVVTTGSGDLQTGLIVDRVEGFARVEETALLPLPESREGSANRYLAGARVIGDEVAALLDINDLLNSETFRGLGFG